MFRNATVKISSKKDESNFGTGFFISDCYIVTCAHVIQSRPLEEILVVWNNVFAINLLNIYVVESHDIALLEFERNSLAFPVLNNIGTAFINESLVSYGYTDEYPLGAPVIVTYEGLTGDDPPFIKFKAGRIRPGLSGSPLIGLSTGKVVGVIKYTASRTYDLGGGAIPIATFREHFPFLEEVIQMSNGSNITREIISTEFTNNLLPIYIKPVLKIEAHADMWRWNQRMFKSRHPETFSELDLVSLELGRSWWQVYPAQDWVLCDWNGEQIGTYCLCPISQESYNDLISGKRIESELTPNDIIKSDNIKYHEYWYVANFIKSKLKTKTDSKVSKYLNSIMVSHALSRALTSSDFASSIGDVINIVAFVESPPVRKIAEEMGVLKAFPHTTDVEKQKIYSASFSQEKLIAKYREAKKILDLSNSVFEKYMNKSVSIFQQPPNY